MIQTNETQESRRLQYIYAQIDPLTSQCFDVFTCTYEIPIPEEYILIPEFTSAYHGKYYKDGHWYADAGFTQPLPELDW